MIVDSSASEILCHSTRSSESGDGHNRDWEVLWSSHVE
jgi:hypothetical protein